jgi:lysine-specific permease
VVPGHAGLDLERAVPGVIFLLNYISVRGFGEAEYWFSLIKVATVIIFIVVGVAMIVRYFQRRSACGLEQLDDGDAPFAGGFRR